MTGRQRAIVKRTSQGQTIAGVSLLGAYTVDKLARVNKLMHDWGDWVVDGKACSGVFGTSAWSAGKPVKATKRPKARRKRDKALVPQPVPHESRIVRPKIPCLRVAYREERVHRIVMNLPESVLPVIYCLYLRCMNYGDTAIVLGITSKKVNRIKRESLKSIDSML